ncbi:MAG: restriction endonuclease subunit S [Methylobacter sp.]|nr:MAG: restriction endonuclease subunit S [Methylobacter sp.]
MSAENKVPAIRFEGFSGEWEEKKLGEVCLIGDIDHKMPQSVKDGIPYLMTGDFIGINDLDFNNAKLISVEDYEQLSKKIKPETGDILFARYASVGAVRYVETNLKFTISYSCAILKSSTTYSEGRYLFYYLQSSKAQHQVELEINTGSQRNIGIDSLKKIIVTFPINKEKLKVSCFIKNLDTLIVQHQQKHDKLLNLKKAMLEKMFPKQGATVPEIRFKGFSGEWSQRAVFELCSISTGKNNTQDKIHDGEYPFYVRSATIERSNNYLFDEEAVLTVGDGVGTGKVYHYVQGKYDLHQRVYRMYDFNGVTGKYFYYYFSNNFYDRVISMTAKTSVDSVRLDMISNMSIKLPVIEEQKNIARFLDSLDTLITQHQAQLKKLNNIKQACLEKMFV